LTHKNVTRNMASNPTLSRLLTFSLAIIGNGIANMMQSANIENTPMATLAGAEVPHLANKVESQASLPRGRHKARNVTIILI
jgi:hypothetical protein